jgi:hypothetical protein
MVCVSFVGAALAANAFDDPLRITERSAAFARKRAPTATCLVCLGAVASPTGDHRHATVSGIPIRNARMRARLASLLSLSLLAAACGSVAPRGAAPDPQPPPQSATDPCDWNAVVLSGDRAAVQVDADAAISRIPSSAIAPDYLGDDLKESSLKGIVLAHALLRRARAPLPVGDVSGAWQVRSIQASGDSVYDYPFFRSTIARSACGFDFRKATGSQRRTGRLLPMDDAPALAFLGTGTVNDNRTGDYGPGNPPRGTAMGSMGDAPVNSAGRLLRIGQNELLMILDMDERGFELYHLKR